MTGSADKSKPQQPAPKPEDRVEGAPEAKGAASVALALLEALETHRGRPGTPASPASGPESAPVPKTRPEPRPEPRPAVEEPAEASIDAALAQLSAKQDVPTLPLSHSVVRAYSVREVGKLLGCCAAAMLLLDADGLLTWVRRMEVGRAQSAWLAVVAPLQKAFDSVGLTRPRRAFADASEVLARELGAGEDPLFAEAWGLVEVAPYLDAMVDEAPGLGVPKPIAAETASLELPAMLLVGDSLFAGNLAAAIGRTFAQKGKVRVVSAYQTATGLSRPDVFDWGRVVSPLLVRERPRWVVCSFGANDAQAIRVGDELLGFGEPAWQAVYEQRARAMMRQVASGGARVLWLGLPPMRDEAYDRRARQLNGIFKRVARALPNVDFMELSMLLAGPDGGYATFVSNGGRLVRVRMEDGVHYAPAGAKAIARWVHDWAREKGPLPAPPAMPLE